MKKILGIIFIVLTLFVMNLFADDMQTYDLPAPYGGKITLKCNAVQLVSQSNFSGGCTGFYQNFSIIKGFVYNGTVLITYSFIGSQNSLMLTFLNGSSFTITGQNAKIDVSFPLSVTFEIDLNSKKCVNVFSDSGKTDYPYLLLNGQKFKLTPEILQYLIPPVS